MVSSKILLIERAGDVSPSPLYARLDCTWQVFDGRMYLFNDVQLQNILLNGVYYICFKKRCKYKVGIWVLSLLNIDLDPINARMIFSSENSLTNPYLLCCTTFHVNVFKKTTLQTRHVGDRYAKLRQDINFRSRKLANDFKRSVEKLCKLSRSPN